MSQLKPALEVILEMMESSVQKALDLLNDFRDYEIMEFDTLLKVIKKSKLSSAEIGFVFIGLQRITTMILQRKHEMDAQTFPRYLVPELDQFAHNLKLKQREYRMKKRGE